MGEGGGGEEKGRFLSFSSLPFCFHLSRFPQKRLILRLELMMRGNFMYQESDNRQQLFTEVELASGVDIYREDTEAAKQRGKYPPPLATDTEVNNYFSIY